jgi:uncharacterized phiE125 gp8 family phage protein
MTSVLEPPALGEAMAEAKANLRVEGSHELLERLAGSAAALCESFIGQWLIVREGAEMLPARAGWQRLRAVPVVAILGVDGVVGEGSAGALAAAAYEIDVDAAGGGWVRIRSPGDVRRARVRFEAGMAAEWSALPEPLRQGIVRLTAHLYSHRSLEGGAGPPAAVTALWRPWRRLGIGTSERRAHV